MNTRWVLLGGCILVACGTTQKKQLIETGAEAMGPEEHPKMLSRFFLRAAPDLKSEPIAETMAKLIAERPASLEMVLSTTIDAIAEKPKARASM